MLEGLGFDASTEAVYRLVLEEPSWDIGKIATHLGWEEDEVRAALDKLAELLIGS